jgi:DNA-binding NtrC family response regulator
VLEQQAIAQAMREVGGNKAQAARKLGISRTRLYVRLRKYENHRGSSHTHERGHVRISNAAI